MLLSRHAAYEPRFGIVCSSNNDPFGRAQALLESRVGCEGAENAAIEFGGENLGIIIVHHYCLVDVGLQNINVLFML